MTSGKRFDLWLRTVTSLRDSVNMSAVSKCVIIDDGSSESDRKNMLGMFASCFPKIGVSLLINDVAGQYRHAHSMELWRAIINEEQLVFHCEDDWGFSNNAPDALSWATTLLAQYDWIGQCVFTVRKRFSPAACQFHVLTQDNSPDFTISRFTLQPSVIRVDSIRKTGGFRQENFEVEYGYRWAGRGYVPVYHPVGICEHIGTGHSCYDLNQSKR